MPQSLGNTIADSLKLSLGYSKNLLKDVTAEQFGRFAVADGKPIESNHGAFIYGHLSLYANKILEDLGQPTIPLPEGFEENFSKDCKCVDDAGGKLPAISTITDYYFEAFNRVMDVLRNTDDEVLQAVNPSEKMAERFPTLGSVINFYTGGHMMLHLGQMSAWRRMHGLGSA
jgi:hypothetical protein